MGDAATCLSFYKAAFKFREALCCMFLLPNAYRVLDSDSG